MSACLLHMNIISLCEKSLWHFGRRYLLHMSSLWLFFKPWVSCLIFFFFKMPKLIKPYDQLIYLKFHHYGKRTLQLRNAKKKKKVAYFNIQGPCFAPLCLILLPLELWPEPLSLCQFNYRNGEKKLITWGRCFFDIIQLICKVYTETLVSLI